MVRREALLRLARDARLPHARARAAVALPGLYALRRLRRCAPEDRGAPVAHRQPRARGRRARRAAAVSPAGCRVERGEARRAPWAVDSRRDAVAGRALPRVLPRPRPAAAAR